MADTIGPLIDELVRATLAYKQFDSIGNNRARIVAREALEHAFRHPDGEHSVRKTPPPMLCLFEGDDGYYCTGEYGHVGAHSYPSGHE